MTVTLDDVACLLYILIAGRLIEKDQLSHDRGEELMENELLFTVEDAVEQVNKHLGGHGSYRALKQSYEELLNRCNQLVEDFSEEEEQGRVRPACVKAFLVLLLGYTIFASKNSKTVNMLWLLAIQNLDELGEWSWDGVRLAFLYDYNLLWLKQHSF